MFGWRILRKCGARKFDAQGVDFGFDGILQGSARDIDGARDVTLSSERFNPGQPRLTKARIERDSFLKIAASPSRDGIFIRG